MNSPPAPKENAALPGAASDRDYQSRRKRADPNAARGAAQSEPPEYGNDRRRFLVAIVMGGFVPPTRMVERVIAEIEHRTTCGGDNAAYL
jgi:hypothetical protein